jgi:FkbM family methyltransferase
MSEGLLKPEYLYRPSQIVRRISRVFAGRPESGTVPMPWGVTMQVRPRDSLSLHLWHLGVLDLPVSEVIWRLLAPGEVGVDVGANMGYYSGLMAARVGRQGRVLAYEPHPEIYKDLRRHADSWAASAAHLARVDAREAAASDVAGTAELFESDEFSDNRGTASLEGAVDHVSHAPKQAVRTMKIRTCRLDEELAAVPSVGVMKVDVEGHEAAVFRGARATLAAGRVRHIVFEEHQSVPSPATELLESLGFTLFKIGRRFGGPVLSSPQADYKLPVWLPPNLLATREPDLVQRVCGASGWQVLG